MNKKQPDSGYLIDRLDIQLPLIGVYDTPAPADFTPLVEPGPGECLFKFFPDWQVGKTLQLSETRYGCGGCGRWMFGVHPGRREDFLKFLVDGEGLKISRDLMGRWIDSTKGYQRTNSHMMIGPLLPDRWDDCLSITFFVNPDQLSALAIGAQYHSKPDDITPVIAPFGSGCMEMLPFKDLSAAQACIGGTDIAMRQHLPPDFLAFTTTRVMFERLCSLDDRSFLNKPFLENLRKERGGSIGNKHRC